MDYFCPGFSHIGFFLLLPCTILLFLIFSAAFHNLLCCDVLGRLQKSLVGFSSTGWKFWIFLVQFPHCSITPSLPDTRRRFFFFFFLNFSYHINILENLGQSLLIIPASECVAAVGTGAEKALELQLLLCGVAAVTTGRASIRKHSHVEKMWCLYNFVSLLLENST